MSGEGQIKITFKDEMRSYRSVAQFMSMLNEQFDIKSRIQKGAGGWYFVILEESIGSKKAQEIRKAFPEIDEIESVKEGAATC